MIECGRGRIGEGEEKKAGDVRSFRSERVDCRSQRRKCG